MPRKKRLTAGGIALRLFFFLAGSLMIGWLTVFLDAELGVYMPRHFSVSIAVGAAVASRSGCCGCSSTRRCS
jgi:hypothetical protein